MKKIMLWAVLLMAIIQSCKVNFDQVQEHANSYFITTTEQLENSEYSKSIDDFYMTGKEGTFFGVDSVKIYYKIFSQKGKGKGAIMISSGRTEAAVKYKELIFDLYKNGYSVYIHDHRGQGQSGRMTEDSQMGYVENFQYYIDDLKKFHDLFFMKGNHKKRFLLAHSMGGAIGMTYLEQFPKDFDAAAFSSPMLAFNPPACTAVKILEGDKIKYAIGESAYNDDKIEFKQNKLTGSEMRYKRMVDAFEKQSDAKLGGATYQWVAQSCQQFGYIVEHIDKIQTPFILFSASNEQIVDVMGHQRFIDKAKSLNKVHIAYLVSDAQHELFIEKDKQRAETITAFLKFFTK
jgi:lysophospholipase